MKLGMDSFSLATADSIRWGSSAWLPNWDLAGVLFELSPFHSFRDDDLARIRAAAEENAALHRIRHGLDFALAPDGRERTAIAGRRRLRHGRLRRPDRHRSSRSRTNSVRRSSAAWRATFLSATKGTTWSRRPMTWSPSSARRAGRRRHGNQDRHGEPRRFHGAGVGFDSCPGRTVRRSALRSIVQPGFRFGRSLAVGRDSCRMPGRRISRTIGSFGPAKGSPWRIVPWATAISICRRSPRRWRNTTREINLNIEIHSQFAPFRLDMLEPGLLGAASFAAGRRAGLVPGEGLGQTAAGSVARQPSGWGRVVAARSRGPSPLRWLGAGENWPNPLERHRRRKRIYGMAITKVKVGPQKKLRIGMLGCGFMGKCHRTPTRRSPISIRRQASAPPGGALRSEGRARRARGRTLRL